MSRPRLSHLDFGELGQDCGPVVIVPSGSLQLASYGAFGGFQADQVECQFAQHSQIIRAMILPVPGLVLVEHHVQDPVQTVLNAPVLPDDVVEPLR